MIFGKGTDVCIHSRHVRDCFRVDLVSSFSSPFLSSSSAPVRSILWIRSTFFRLFEFNGPISNN